MMVYYIKLRNRGLIHIEGEDRHEFLQNLISNDMDLLKQQKCVYACLLTPQGKFLHDFFVLEGDSFILLDCEGGERAQDLYKRLNLYRLRAKVLISVEEHNDVYAVYGAQTETGVPDPRHPAMGWRSFDKPEDADERSFEDWDERRIRLCIPDGSRDMVPEKSTLLECRIDKLQGVSFEKGCYVGQELTARMHHRGLAKKHLHVVQGDPLPETGAAIEINGKPAGEMRSSCGNVGLALLKNEMVPPAQKVSL